MAQYVVAESGQKTVLHHCSCDELRAIWSWRKAVGETTREAKDDVLRCRTVIRTVDFHSYCWFARVECGFTQRKYNQSLSELDAGLSLQDNNRNVGVT